MSISRSSRTLSSEFPPRMPRLDALTGLRWWAAFFVFTYHMLVFAPLPGIASAIFGQGFYGVTFFFVLSGFVLTWSLSPTVSQSTFYWRRFARVYPTHFVALVLAIPVFYSFTPDPEQTWVKQFSIGVILLSVLLLQGWSRDPAILFSGNPAAWTLTSEAFFYAVHPYLSRILSPLQSRGALIFVGSTVVLLFGYRLLALLQPDAWIAVLPLPLTRVTEFAIGMGLAWALRRGWLPRIPMTVGFGAAALTLAAIVGTNSYLQGSFIAALVGGFANELITVACGLAILSVASQSMRQKATSFEHPWLVRLGEWSFAFYLVHATIIYAIVNVFGQREVGWGNLIWFPVLFVPCLAAAAMLHHWVERPLEKRMRRWKDAREQRNVALSGV